MSDDCGLLSKAPPQSLWVMYHSEVFRVVGLGCTQSECHGGEGAGRGISYPRIVSEVDYLQVHFRIDV